MLTPRQELITFHNSLKKASNTEVNAVSFVRRSRCSSDKDERDRGSEGEKEEKEIEQDIFTELKVSTSASHRPTLQLPQNTQRESQSNVSVHH